MLQFNITLCHSNPSIWRRVLVPADATFAQLHTVLQRAFGWGDMHQHAFHEREPYRSPEISPRKKLATYFTQASDTAIYLYDFGDGWEHQITCESVDVDAGAKKTAHCVDGANATPPEDCGGIDRYYDILAAAQDPTHPDHEELSDWLGDDFDAAAFDVERVNKRLGRGK